MEDALQKMQNDLECMNVTCQMKEKYVVQMTSTWFCLDI